MAEQVEKRAGLLFIAVFLGENTQELNNNPQLGAVVVASHTF